MTDDRTPSPPPAAHPDTAHATNSASVSASSAACSCACPQPPRRLMADRVLLNKRDVDPAWESRRANKMRERFPVGFREQAQPLPTLNLVAPVQPSLSNPAPFHENQL